MLITSLACRPLRVPATSANAFRNAEHMAVLKKAAPAESVPLESRYPHLFISVPLEVALAIQPVSEYSRNTSTIRCVRFAFLTLSCRNS